MVADDKQRGALQAINAILVLCRSLAHEGKSAELAVILDVAEYLPMLMLENQDRTDAFRAQLVDLAERYPMLALALERFDGARRDAVHVTSKVTLELPLGFGDHAWEVEAKGRLAGLVAVIEGRRYTITVYDPVRLAQDVDDDLRRRSAFVERNLVVVASVTLENIATAIEQIVETGMLGDLRPDQG
jgi:hypothetical protein